MVDNPIDTNLNDAITFGRNQAGRLGLQSAVPASAGTPGDNPIQGNLNDVTTAAKNQASRFNLQATDLPSSTAVSPEQPNPATDYNAARAASAYGDASVAYSQPPVVPSGNADVPGTLSLNPAPVAPPTGSLELTQKSVPSLQDAGVIASKADFAMGQQSPGQDQIKNGILSGDEDQMRQTFAAQQDATRSGTVSTILQQMAKGPVTPQSNDLMKGLFSIDPTNPQTVWEQAYANKYLRVGMNVNPSSSVFSDAIRNPLTNDPMLHYSNATADIITKQQIVNRLEQDNTVNHQNRGWLPAIGDFAMSALPLVNAIRMHNAAGADGNIMPGSNLGAQFDSLYGDTNDNFYARAQEAMKGMTLDERDIFLDGLKSYPTSSKVFNNLTAVADVTTLGEVGYKAGVGIVRRLSGAPTAEAVEGLRSIALSAQLSERADATTASKVDVQDALTTVGSIDKAAQTGATQRIQSGVQKLDNAWDRADPLAESWPLRKDLPSLSNPSTIDTGNPSALSREGTARLTNKLTSNATNIIDAIAETQRVQRITVPLESAQLDTAWAAIKNDYPQISDGILDVATSGVDGYGMYHPNSTNITNAVVRMGKNSAELFDSREQAQTWAKDVYALPDQSFRPVQQGTGFFLELNRPIDETADGMRALMLETGNKSPASVFNLLLGKIRSAEDLVSPFNSANRKIATYGPNQLKAVAVRMAKDIGSIGSKNVNEISDVLRVALSKDNPATGKPGLYPQSIQDWESAFREVHNKLPNEKQTQSYFSTLQLNDMDYMVRNLGMYTDKARHGAQDFRFSFNQAGEAGIAKTDFYTAVRREDLPWKVPDDAGVLVSQTGKAEGAGTQKYFRMNDIKNDPSDEITQLRKDIKEGRLHVLQTYDPLGDAKKTLSEAAGVEHPVHFVVTDSDEAKRLDWKQIDYQPGHAFYQSEWYIKQPKISTGVNGRLTYWGDTTIRAASTEAQARKFAFHYDEARKLLLDGDEAGLAAYVRRNIPESLEDFKKLFSGGGPDGGLDASHPIVHTYTGRSTIESSEALAKHTEYKNLYENQGSAFNLAQQMNKKQIAEKGAIIPQLNETNRLVSLQPAKLLDPYPAMNRALSQAVRSRYMDDYKLSSAMAWVEEHAPVLTEQIDKLRRNPLYYLYHPPFREGAAGVNTELLNQAKLTRQTIMSFMGTSSDLQKNVDWLKNRLFNSIYNTLGPKAAEFTSDHLASRLKDPAAFARSIAFHTNIGMFNPVHLLMQSQSLLHVMAVAGPKAGIPGHLGAWLSRFLLSRQDADASINHFDKIAQNMLVGWKPGEFGEMFRSMRDSGFSRVMGETAMRDDVKSPNIWSGTGLNRGFHTFLDKGTIFYTEAERMVRMAAYATAYKEWKSTPSAVDGLERRAQMAILQRADLLAVNMSAASASGIQHGAASVITQFTAFSMRLAEQLLGSRLTRAEKARAFGMYATMYGIPTTMAGVTGIWPFYEDWRTQAMNQGVDMKTFDYKAIHEGLLSMILSSVTGHDYNFADRYGPFATSLLHDFWYGDKTLVEVLSGPAGSQVYNFYKSSFPFTAWLGAQFGTENFPAPTSQDILDVLKNISSIGNLSKGLVAMNLGKLYSKNDNMVSEQTSKMDAVMAGIFGLSNTQVSDTYLKSEWMEHNKKSIAVAEQDAVKEMKRSIEAGGKGDLNTAEMHRMRFQVIVRALDLQDSQVAKLFGQASKGFMDLVHSVNAQWLEQLPQRYYRAAQDQSLKDINQK